MKTTYRPLSQRKHRYTLNMLRSMRQSGNIDVRRLSSIRVSNIPPGLTFDMRVRFVQVDRSGTLHLIAESAPTEGGFLVR